MAPENQKTGKTSTYVGIHSNQYLCIQGDSDK